MPFTTLQIPIAAIKSVGSSGALKRENANFSGEDPVLGISELTFEQQGYRFWGITFGLGVIQPSHIVTSDAIVGKLDPLETIGQ